MAGHPEEKEDKDKQILKLFIPSFGEATRILISLQDPMQAVVSPNDMFHFPVAQISLKVFQV